MPTATSALHDERASTLAKAQSVVRAAMAANRELTTTEQKTCSDAVERVKVLDSQIEGRNLITSVMGGPDPSADPTRQPVFDEQSGRELVAAVKSRGTFRTEVPAKAALTATALPTSGQQVSPGIYPSAAFPLATLFGTEEAAGPSVRYYRLGGATADVVAEGVTKPDSGLTVTGVDLLLTKIATTVRFSDEFSDDASFLLGHLEGELRSAVVTRENAHIVSTFTTTSGVLTSTGTAGTVIDLIADAIAVQEATNGMSPAAVVVHPTVLATIRKAKAVSGGEYVVDPLTGSVVNLHGTRVVSTVATPAATVWVANAAGVVIYRRGGITAEIGMNADDFQTNQRTMRVEERFATAVTRPSMLSKITLT